MNTKDHETVQPLLTHRISQVVLDPSEGTKRSLAFVAGIINSNFNFIARTT